MSFKSSLIKGVDPNLLPCVYPKAAPITIVVPEFIKRISDALIARRVLRAADSRSSEEATACFIFISQSPSVQGEFTI